MTARISLFQLLVSLIAVAELCAAQLGPYNFMPFNLIGGITGMSLNTSSTNPLRGGSIQIDGINILVPTNLLPTLPALTVAWQELFDAQNNGLAVGFEANVIGNTVNGVNYAGMISIAQRPTQILQGFIEKIDSTTGQFVVNGVAMIIDDPTGRYGPATTGDELWASDPDNPSIHAATGMPVCISTTANAKTCPAGNRPIDPTTQKASTSWTFKDPATLKIGELPDPRLLVPLVVGDYVTVTGTERGGILKVNALNANLGIFTSPGTQPAYVSCESVNYGIVTTQGPAEFAETRAVTFTTDPTQTVSWYAQDVDPCTGNITERLILQVQPQNVAAPIGRAVFRLGKTDVSPAPRNAVFRLSKGTVDTAGGIKAGQFIQPIFNYIFPELLAFGGTELENRFDVINFLGQGSGPYTPGTFGLTGPNPPVIVGQLSPWPGSSPPNAPVCAPPIATSSTTVPSTLSTITTVASPTPSTPPVDTIVITAASKVKSNRGGFFRVTVSATTTGTDPKNVLTFTVNGVTPVTGALMTQDPKNPGSWSGNIDFKGTATSVQVFSSFGGKSQVVTV